MGSCRAPAFGFGIAQAERRCNTAAAAPRLQRRGYHAVKAQHGAHWRGWVVGWNTVPMRSPAMIFGMLVGSAALQQAVQRGSKERGWGWVGVHSGGGAGG